TIEYTFCVGFQPLPTYRRHGRILGHVMSWRHARDLPTMPLRGKICRRRATDPRWKSLARKFGTPAHAEPTTTHRREGDVTPVRVDVRRSADVPPRDRGLVGWLSSRAEGGALPLRRLRSRVTLESTRRGAGG